ncbi:MAG: methyltransferase domain-containing protein, partial [Solirubrobacterales bacterium]|nr:methyltransferase domain-containing protein [Solirubrobacterales bacterium]
SSAWFPDRLDGDDDRDLEAAQLRKIDGILDYARVGDGTRLLEIGTGWGALAMRAAERGAYVTTITISGQQRELARRRIAEAGLGDRIEVRLQDYREVEGEYDAVVSVEMIEAVGEEFWPTYFATLDRLRERLDAISPDGLADSERITRSMLERALRDDRDQATRALGEFSVSGSTVG